MQRFLCRAIGIVCACLFFTHAYSQVEIKWQTTILMDGAQGKLAIEQSEFLDTTLAVQINEAWVNAAFNSEGVAVVEFPIVDRVELYWNDDTTIPLESNPIPLWLSILPPLLAIVIALITKEVVSSLLLGIVSGGVIVGMSQSGISGIITGFTRTIDHYIINAITDWGHGAVILFSIIIGGMVSVISKNGGMQAIVNRISKRAKDPKSGQMATYILGIAIFFDDYANTLVVGNTMRAVTDRLRISREKLAYIVDSTAAPIAAIAFVTTWIGAELGYISDGVKQIETSLGVSILEGPYTIFMGSLSYSFYPILTLLFILFLILKQRDFGPMLQVERTARLHGVSDVGVSGTDHDEFAAEEGVEPKAYRAFIPILVVILGTIVGLLYTGWNAEIWANESFSFGKKLSKTIGASDSYLALLWSSMFSLVLAIALSLNIPSVKLNKTIEWSITGFKSMINAVIILVLAWALAGVTKELHTADFLTQSVGDWLPVFLVPAFTFILAAIVAFSTGSSWGTMAILYPLVLPLGWMVCQLAGLEYEATMSIFYHVVSCVLAGSVLGDHCSPISDTTILSSLASRCNHIQHVKTQMPYALTVGAVAVVVCSIPSALGVNPFLTLLVGAALLYFIVIKKGKKV